MDPDLNHALVLAASRLADAIRGDVHVRAIGWRMHEHQVRLGCLAAAVEFCSGRPAGWPSQVVEVARQFEAYVTGDEGG